MLQITAEYSKHYQNITIKLWDNTRNLNDPIEVWYGESRENLIREIYEKWAEKYDENIYNLTHIGGYQKVNTNTVR